MFLVKEFLLKDRKRCVRVIILIKNLLILLTGRFLSRCQKGILLIWAETTTVCLRLTSLFLATVKFSLFHKVNSVSDSEC